MNATAENIRPAPELPAPVARRGISEAQWRTLVNNLYPGAKPESVCMVWDYCVARKLDPLKKPCHIVPMQVYDAQSGSKVWRDVVMPGIYEYRTTAIRTGFYLGHSKPEYGEPVEHMGVTVPAWCDMVIYRWNKEAQCKTEFPVRVYFVECAATRYDKDKGCKVLNQRWATAPVQMMTKCAEAAGLREAFPDEIGGEATAEEMEGRIIDIPASSGAPDPRGDLTKVDFELANRHVSAVADILALDIEENEKAEKLREYDAEALSPFPELAIMVADKLAESGICTKSQYRAWLKVGLDRK